MNESGNDLCLFLSNWPTVLSGLHLLQMIIICCARHDWFHSGNLVILFVNMGTGTGWMDG